ncbi:MAG: FHA domain-containing protein [bacterium]|nr:FHA domain-containing protein [bacterium]
MIAFRLQGPGVAEQRLETTARTITIGRAPDQAVVVHDPAVSRHHGEVYLEGCDYWYRDLHSTHGTFECCGAKRTPVDHLRLSEGICLAIGTPGVTMCVERIDLPKEPHEAYTAEALSEDQPAAEGPAHRAPADTLALQGILRLDRRLADEAADSTTAILGALLATMTELYHDAEYVAILEAVDGKQRVLDYALLAGGQRIPEIPEAIEHLARAKAGFLFTDGPGMEFAPQDDAHDGTLEPTGMSGLCVPLGRGVPIRWVQLERSHDTAPLTPRDLDVATSLATRAGDRIGAGEVAGRKGVL